MTFILGYANVWMTTVILAVFHGHMASTDVKPTRVHRTIVATSDPLVPKEIHEEILT